MHARPRIEVIVISYNTRAHLERCLDSIDKRYKVTVVDNGSTDGSLTLIENRFPAVNLVRNQQNLGFAAAANLGIKYSDADFVLLLNADTRVTPASIAALCDYLSQNPSVAIVGPALLNPDGSRQRSCFPMPGTTSWLLENDPIGFLITLVPPIKRRTLRHQHDKVRGCVPWVLGAAMLVRRDAVMSVGGFDESYHMYFEEVDLCLNLKAHGWETHIEPLASIEHVGGASTSQYRTAMRIRHFASTMKFYDKHCSAAGARAWRLMMLSKIAARLGADAVRLALVSDTSTRLEISQDLRAWRSILLHGTGSVTADHADHLELEANATRSGTHAS